MTTDRAVRLACKCAALAPALLIGLPIQLLAVRFNSPLARRLPLWFHRYVARVIGLKIRIEGQVPSQGPALLLSNHVSWLDIVALGSAAPVSFVAKSEVARWPLFGTLARLQGVVFVERERRAATGKAADGIAARLSRGEIVVLFPEGTTGDGRRVLGYRSALIGAAHLEDLTAPAPVIPAALVYRARDGLPLTRRERPEVAWYGDMDLMPHLTGALSGGPLDVTVVFGAPLPGGDKAVRKSIAREAEMFARQAQSAKA